MGGSPRMAMYDEWEGEKRELACRRAGLLVARLCVIRGQAVGARLIGELGFRECRGLNFGIAAAWYAEPNEDSRVLRDRIDLLRISLLFEEKSKIDAKYEEVMYELDNKLRGCAFPIRWAAA